MKYYETNKNEPRTENTQSGTRLFKRRTKKDCDRNWKNCYVCMNKLKKFSRRMARVFKEVRKIDNPTNVEVKSICQKYNINEAHYRMIKDGHKRKRK